MRTVIAGSRTITDLEQVRVAVEDCGWTITEVVSGCARGVDTLGEIWAMECYIPVKLFPADWTLHGRAAGPIRNNAMAEYADAAIVIHNGSPGSIHMCEAMRYLNKPVFEVIVVS